MLAKQVYTDAEPSATVTRPERRGVSRRRVIDEAKSKVSTLDLAERLTGPGVRRGREIFFICPLHDDHNPSLRVEPEQDVWFCDPCLVGGDVIELARYAWNYDKSAVAMAAANILDEFGHEIPKQPASWYRKQQRQKPIRAGIEAAKVHAARFRLYQRFFEPLVLASTNEEDRKHDAQLFWEATRPLAEDLVGSMMGRGR